MEGSWRALFIFMCFLITDIYCQADKNPHNWDRTRRCDQQDYDPPCGLCEGIGGIPYGSKNNEIELTTCSPVGTPEEMPEPMPILWGKQWTLPLAYEVLIGKKNDQFCFQTFPGNDSVGDLCYVKQTGAKVYDMVNARAFREDLERETVVGNETFTAIHQGINFWVINHLPPLLGGLNQCICTNIREGGVENGVYYYPVQYNWIDKMVYIGREIIGIEYITEVREMDHWAFGPHHLWSDPATGNIIRMWQPFNGLQVYPTGVAEGNVDSTLFEEIPPALCKKGGALMRFGCDADGYPTLDKKVERKSPKNIVKKKDIKRAEEKVPRAHFKGMDFGEMSEVLNGWLNSSMETKPCMDWEVEDLQRLQAMFYLARDSTFDDIYYKSLDNRRIRHDVLKDLAVNWVGLNKIASSHPDPRMKAVRRDGHCHEAVMWYVHHLTEDMKEMFKTAQVPLPLLSPARHQFCQQVEDEEGTRVCGAYQEQVTCASCHSNEIPPEPLV